MDFIIRRFQQLSRKNKLVYSKSNGLRGSSSKDNIDDQKKCFNCKKHGHFIDDCPGLLRERSKKEGFQKDNFMNKLKKILMATWNELDNKDEFDKDEGEANLALMDMEPSNTEYESTLDSYLDEEDEVFSNLSRSNLISFILEPMSLCQNKQRLMKTLKKECGLLKEELKIPQNKVENLDKEHITLVNKLSNKNLNEHEIDLQDFIMTGIERTKLAYIIYGVSKSKGKDMSYNENKAKAQLIKTPNASPSSNSQTDLKTYFVPASDKGKSLNKSKPKMVESKVLNKLTPNMSKSKVVKDSEPNIQKLKVLKRPEPKNSKSKVLKRVESKNYGPKICLRGETKHQYWYLDSGCSHHMTGEKLMFQTLTLKEEGSVGFGGGQKGKIIGTGTIGNSLISTNNIWMSDISILFKGKRTENVYKINISELTDQKVTREHQEAGSSEVNISKVRGLEVGEPEANHLPKAFKKVEDSEEAQDGLEMSAQPNQSFKYKYSYLEDLIIGNNNDPLKTRSAFKDDNCMYLKGTTNMGLLYNKSLDYKLIGFCDADCTRDRTERKSTSRNCQFIGENLISLANKRQATIALSTGEVGYISVAKCCT
ncbi:uncharacterized protein LOC127094028 [Lathyrus oleraceus]|uniref:uncharacterized protein LOC127094028 n=1 Tax=Pisum sativum TaxID=3888 RepID=UPI0021D36D9B|nr:uncharacterized protein LOC127094028 [Pisum sativum]